ncbi:glycosyltransferase [Microbacterium algeriense]|uniref:glycosyltransferase n=1 Tax=Microbacterium algeriense TaxID=2615184 RepID=UPI0002FAAF67|nr:glycosyltransferase [Microbacterium barkeri]
MSSHGFGTIVLAAYSPDPELLRRQLESLRAQTVSDWECVISVDGEVASVAELVFSLTHGDERFRVLGDGTRLGFYLNFERGLSAVSEESGWIALCDQDDRWDADKIERLLPHLSEVSLVSGQARIVTYPSEVETGRTQRSDNGPLLTILSNEFTGSLCLFSPDLLRTALPFPRASTRVATHDHWLAVVAAAHKGTRIVDDVVQDYVQHDANVFGDPSRLGGGSLGASVRNVLAQAERFEGSRSPLAVARMTFWTYVGWRQLMVDTLDARVGPAPERAPHAQAFGRARTWRALSSVLRRARAREIVPARFAWEYRASWICGALAGGRRAVARTIRRDAVEEGARPQPEGS